MNAALLLIPLFLIRYGLLALINKEALPKAAHFAPMQGIEQSMNLFYQASTLFIIVYMFFLKITKNSPWLAIGLVVYLLGVLLFVISVMNFAKPDKAGFSRHGLYRFSRNPMYLAYFVYFLGCVLLTQSLLLLLFVLIFQISSHWIILAEERWCKENFGSDYDAYMEKVRRYL